MAFVVEDYVLPHDEDGNVIENPLMWLVPPPCLMHQLTPEQRARFARFVSHVIESRLHHDGSELKVDSIAVLRPLAKCRVQTQHEYLIHFTAENVEEDGRDHKKDVLAAIPLGVREVKVTHSIEQLPLTAEAAANGRVTKIAAHYIVHCHHNVRTAGRTPVPPKEAYVQVL